MDGFIMQCGANKMRLKSLIIELLLSIDDNLFCIVSGALCASSYWM